LRRKAIMSRILRFLLLLAIVVVVVGFYRGWFELSTDRQEQKTGITVTVDMKKVEEDKEKAMESLKGLEHKLQSTKDSDKNKG
jgi:hypothetical protein